MCGLDGHKSLYHTMGYRTALKLTRAAVLLLLALRQRGRELRGMLGASGDLLSAWTVWVGRA